jgi:hypothetical protein
LQVLVPPGGEKCRAVRKITIVPGRWLDAKIPDMKTTKTWTVAVLLGALLCLGGCNAISFFPRQAAEKAADTVIDDVFPGNGAQGETARQPELKKP